MKERTRPRHRFAVAPAAIRGGQVHFSPQVARQMRRVLRLRPGDRVLVLDGEESEYVVSLATIRDELAIGTVESRSAIASEPRLKLTLCQALLPRDRFEAVLQKGTEVGVSCFVPLVTQRSLVPADALGEGRLERWRRIIQEAGEQAGRGLLPELLRPRALAEALADFGGDSSLLAWECETKRSIRQALAPLERELQGSRLILYVGPEGGFTAAEALAARTAGAVTVSLGPRTLRAETAGPILAALALYQAGDLEPLR